MSTGDWTYVVMHKNMPVASIRKDGNCADLGQIL